jgi:hypothetical protein
MKTNFETVSLNKEFIYNVTEEYNNETPNISQNKIDKSKSMPNKLENIIKPHIVNKIEQNSSTKKKNNSGPKQSTKKNENTQLALKKRTDLVKTYVFNYEGVDYLVDNKNNVFTFNIDNPRVIGIKLIDNTVKFY